MAVSEATRRDLYRRAEGRCQCTMKVCDHRGRCTRGLSAGYWDAHHRRAGGPDTPSNLIAMCATCHKNTRTYGR
ncbi:hypothetical protein LCGC14_1441960 [marine sediment metagenome]|uniref:HNH domain-containing protein n=1 Tax=marine sediment metagenome TaxID=412755 RepID=A0A0F9JL34_9ZZZZ